MEDVEVTCHTKKILDIQLLNPFVLGLSIEILLQEKFQLIRISIPQE